MVVEMSASLRPRYGLRRFATRSGALALLFALGQYMLVGSGFGCHEASHAGVANAVAMSVQPASDGHDHCADAPDSSRREHGATSCTAMVVCGALVMTAQVSAVATVIQSAQEVPRVATMDALTRNVAPDPPPPRT